VRTRFDNVGHGRSGLNGHAQPTSGAIGGSIDINKHLAVVEQNRQQPVPGAPAAQPSSVWSSPQPTSPYPSEQISLWHHPIKYFEASVPAIPVGWKSKTASHPVMPSAAQKPDPLSLSVPTGPPSPEFFIFAAQVCERQGDVAQARQNLQRALGMWPGNAEVLRAAARMEDRQGNLPLAESLYQQAVASNPQNAAALNDLGLCLAREGKLEPSLQAIEQAIQLQPDKALFRNNAATVLVETRQDQRRWPTFRTCTIPPKRTTTLANYLWSVAAPPMRFRISKPHFNRIPACNRLPMHWPNLACQ